MSEESDIVIRNVAKCFGDTQALKGIEATIRAGRITGLVGPDGAGKTTLIRLMAGLLLPDEGSITVCGLDTREQAEEIHEILGYMPQKFGLYEDLTVQENLELYARLRGVTGEEKEKSFERMLDFTDLKRFTDRLAGKLSGGMKQKLGLACALLSTPKALLLDEPSVGVDPISRRELWKMVQELVEGGMAVIWSTAYLDEAERCDDVLLLNEGELLFSGKPSELTQKVEGRAFLFQTDAQHRRKALTELIKSRAVIDGVIQGDNVRVVLAENADPAATGFELRQVKPRFEDAFIDILGGIQIAESELAKEIERKDDNDTPPIEAQHLTKKFGDFTAAHDISFQVKRGEIFGLLGPNGAGKSTCFKMLCGLLQPTSGKALVTGLDLKTSTSEARMKIGYMAQKFSLYSDLNVKQNLEFFSGVYGLAEQERREKIEQMITIFELKRYLKSNAGELPLGYKQRLALACAVMHEPDVLFLDEPTSGVDPLTRREFWMHINGMVDRGVTIMVTTHFMDEAEYCDRIALIYRAENIATGTPDELKSQIANDDHPEPTLEDAFIALVEQFDADSGSAKEAA
jgi:ABC-2 type transport system ATP-binding protein